MEEFDLADIWMVLKLLVKVFARRVMLRINTMMLMVCAEGYAPYTSNQSCLELLMMVYTEGYAPYFNMKYHAVDGLRGGLCSVYIKPELLEL